MTQMTRDKGQLQMLQNPVHNLIFREEGDDSHPPALMEAMSTARLPHRGQISGSTSL
jgi:hypothetical protein